MNAPRFTVLGSGTLLPDDRRHSAAHLLEAGGVRVLLDCGSGTLHGFDRFGIGWRDLDAVVFSHYHTDHLGDVASLLFALKHGTRGERTAPLALVGPPGLGQVVEGLRRAFGDHVEEPGFPVAVRELGRSGSWEAGGGGLHVRFHPTPHTDHSVAHRWEAGDVVVAYTGDTGPSPELADFAAGADLLICECSVPDHRAMETHLTPSQVAELARAAQPDLLVLTHIYPPLVPGEVPGLVREAGYTGRVELGRDGMSVTWSEEEPEVGMPERG